MREQGLAQGVVIGVLSGVTKGVSSGVHVVFVSKLNSVQTLVASDIVSSEKKKKK